MTRKHPTIRLEDILTISAERAGFIAGIRDALNLFGRDFQNYTTTNLAEAENIYNVIALTRRNVDLLDRPAAALPCIVEFSNSGIIKSVSGRHQQMEFLLESLRRSFPKEYDAHQQLREGSFQRALERLLTEAFPGLETRRNINLRGRGRHLTDIDFIAIDRQFGDLFLVHLKFQDRPGADFRAEASKMNRFRDESVRWLAAVEGWLADADQRAIRSTFRIHRNVPINRVRKLIIGRHHAWPLHSVQLGEDTAYATWNQLVNTVILMERKQGDFRTLNGLHGVLRKYIVGAAARYHQDEGPIEYVLDSLKFAITQQNNQKAAFAAAGTKEDDAG